MGKVTFSLHLLFTHMKSHQITIKDIARELGVSISTVSRALKDHPDISPETKQLVRDLVEKMKYKPNAIALSLRNRHTRIIGVVVPEIVHHFFSSVISGIDEAAMAAGYNVMFFQSNESYEREILNIQSLINSRVDGVLISVAKGSKKFNHLKQLVENNIPLVFFDRACDEIETDRVIVDDFEGAFNAVDYLIRTGCRRIAHFAGPPHLQIAYLRKRGYISALEKNGLQVDDNLIITCDSYDCALSITRQIMSQPDIPDAIFTVNDETAVGTLNCLKRMGFRVPEDVSIVGFTDGLVSSVTDPLLTTVSQHGFEIGKKAATILIKRITDDCEIITPMVEVVKTDLVIRNSTRRL
jgi:DNA-binding LacI/PurR family transcriptional regulator